MSSSVDEEADNEEMLGFVETDEPRQRKPVYPSTILTGKLGFKKKGTRAPYVNDASGLPFDYDCPARRRDPSALGNVAANLLEKIGVEVELPEKSSIEEAMLQVWPQVLGEELKGKLEPEKYVRGILYVFARNNTELFEIRQFKLRALEERARRHAAFAGLKQIRIRTK